MQKVIKPSDFEHYFSGTYNIRGFITRAQDVKHLDTPEEIIDGLALHYKTVEEYGQKAYNYSDYSVGAIRFPAVDISKINIPIGGNKQVDKQRIENILNKLNDKTRERVLLHVDGRPYTGNGTTLSDNFVVPEFMYVEGFERELVAGTEIYEFTRTGHKVLVAFYNSEKKLIKTFKGINHV